MTETTFDQPFPLGEPDDAFAQYFIRQSYLAPLVGGGTPALRTELHRRRQAGTGPL